MASRQRVSLTPLPPTWRLLLPALLGPAWLLARATATLLYDEVWVAARAGLGVFQPMRAWYDHYGEATVFCLAGLLLAGLAVALWSSLRPVRRWERWVLALLAPAVAFTAGAPFLLQAVAGRGQAQAMATLTTTLQPVLEAAQRAPLAEADREAAALRLAAALPCMAWSQGRTPALTVAFEPPDTGDDALVTDTTLVVRDRSWWVAWDARSRTWVDKYTWHRRLCSQGSVR